MIERQVDFDALGRPADFELDAAGPADTARRGDDASDRRALGHQLDITLKKEQP